MSTYVNRDLERIRDECLELIENRAYVSAGTSVVPIPFFDVVADAGQLSLLIPEINMRFGLDEDKDTLVNADGRSLNWRAVRERALDLGQLLITRSALRKSVQSVAGRILAKQFAKFIPFSGQIAAAGIGYFVFKKVAEDHINDCYRLAKELQRETEHFSQQFSQQTTEHSSDKPATAEDDHDQVY